MASEEEMVQDVEQSGSSDEEDMPQVESLVSGREKRARAGAKMASLLESEVDKDEFYSSTYGGFEEEENDDDFTQDQSSSDEVDSDFDIDETDEPIAQDEDEDEGKKTRAKRTAKMAYEIAADRRKAAENKVSQSQDQAKKAKPPVRTYSKSVSLAKPEEPSVKSPIYENRVLRNRKRPKKLEQNDSGEEEAPKPKVSPKKKRKRNRHSKEPSNKIWTQEELLAESKKTEAENLASLQKYQLLELERAEKRKAKRVARELKEPFVRFISTSMPDVPRKVTELKSEDLSDASCKNERVERTFIIFSDESAFKASFPSQGPVHHPSSLLAPNSTFARARTGPMAIKKGTAVCPVGHVRAKYFDPVTQVPYSSTSTFKILREAYCNQLEAMYGRPKQAIESALTPAGRKEMNTWLEWRRKHKRPLASSSSTSDIRTAPQPTVVTSSSTTTRG